jgi:hypothetical protein
LLSRLIDLDRDGQFFVFVDNWEVIMKLNLSTKMDDKWRFSFQTSSKMDDDEWMMISWEHPWERPQYFSFSKGSIIQLPEGAFPLPSLIEGTPSTEDPCGTLWSLPCQLIQKMDSIDHSEDAIDLAVPTDF